MKYFDFKENASFLQSLDPTEYTLTSMIIAIIMSSYLSTNEKNSIGNFLIEVGQTLLTIASQENLLANLNHSNTHINLEQRIIQLERELNALKTSRFKDK